MRKDQFPADLVTFTEETVSIHTRILQIFVTEIIKVKIRESPTIMYLVFQINNSNNYNYYYSLYYYYYDTITITITSPM